MKIKSFVSLILSLVFIFSLEANVFAQEVACDDHHPEVEITESQVLAQTEVFLGKKEMSPNACSHSNYTPWRLLESWYEYGPTINSCYKYVQVDYRSCTTCGQMFTRTTRTQLSHSYYSYGAGKKCYYCGSYIVNLSNPDINQ